jgi:hypothetical protein
VPARILLFSLDDLRRVFGDHLPRGADPRADTTAFRAFRAALLDAAASGASEPCDLWMWWEGTFNGYALAVSVAPPGALTGLRLDGVCPLEAERVAPPRPDRYPLAHVEPGRAAVARDREGGTWEAPFGEATGHFGAPGMRNIR